MSVTATVVGVAADAAVGTVKIVGKGVGKAYDAVTEDKPDSSGIQVHYRTPDEHALEHAPAAAPALPSGAPQDASATWKISP